MPHLLIAAGIFAGVLGPIIWTIALRWRGQVSEEQKRLLEAIISAVQLAALLAGGYWFAMKYLLSEHDKFGPRITIERIREEVEMVKLDDDKEGCRVSFTWGAKNNGPAAGRITSSRFVLRKLSVAYALTTENGGLPYVEKVGDGDGEIVVDERLAGPSSPLRPGSLHEWSRTVVFPNSPERYAVEAEVYVDGDLNPWTSSQAVRCATNPATHPTTD